MNSTQFTEVRHLGDKRKVKGMVSVKCRKVKVVMEEVFVVVKAKWKRGLRLWKRDIYNRWRW